MRIFIIISLLIVFQLPSFGQYDMVHQGFSIGVTPSAFLNRWLALQGKVAYAYRDFELEMNVGFLKGQNNDEPYSGYRIRPVLKYYFTVRDDKKFYLGFGGLYRKLNIEAKGTFERFNNSFYQELDFDLTQNMKGYYGMFGFLIPFDDNRFFVDCGFGFGPSIVTTELSGVPDDAILIYNAPLFTKQTRSAGETKFPIAIIHFAFMYKFGRGMGETISNDYNW